MSGSTQEIKNEIQIKRKIYLFLHKDGFNGKSLEPIVLVDNERINVIFLKKTINTDMYYVFQGKNYLKIWKDRKDNILLYFDNWIGDLFVSNPQTVEYVNDFSYTAGSHELICENRNEKRKKLILEGFDIIPLAINQFTKYETAIFYILCYKLS